MNLHEYFEGLTGHGVIATAGKDGKVDVAVYARPYVVDDKRVAFIVADRLTRRNLMANPHAGYLFKEPGEGFQGKRLFLTMEKEVKGDTVTDPVLKGKYTKACEEYSKETLSVIYFRVDKVLPLVGDAE